MKFIPIQDGTAATDVAEGPACPANVIKLILLGTLKTKGHAMIEIPITALIIMIGIFFIQRLRIEAEHRKDEAAHFIKISEELEKKLKEFDEYKKKVDALVIKAGFKL